MRVALGAGLALAATAMVGVVATPAYPAANACDDGVADTTWVGPASDGGSTSWGEPANWTDGVPTATSLVCIPATATGPLVPWMVDAAADVIDAEGATVTLQGQLSVGTGFDVAVLVGDDGELAGPGTTTVTDSITGSWLTLRDAARVDLDVQASGLGGHVEVRGGSRLDVRGDVLLEPGSRIDSFGYYEDPGAFTVTETGSLTFDSPDQHAFVVGGFANHGEVNAVAGQLTMYGVGDRAAPDQYSTGRFAGAPPEGRLFVAYTELRTGAVLDRVSLADHIAVPAAQKVTASDSTLAYDPESPELALGGAGELVVTDGSFVGGRIGGSLTVSVPAGEVAQIRNAVVQDSVRLRVDGELAQNGVVYLDDEAVLDVYGVHRGDPGGVVSFSGADPGLEIIHPDGQLVSDEGKSLSVVVPFVGQGTVRSGPGDVALAPRAASPAPSSGTFRADQAGKVYLGYDRWGAPPLELERPVIEGAVQVMGEVQAGSPQLRAHITTWPGNATTRVGRLTLTGSATLSDGASLTGDVVVAGHLEADLGATGTGTVDGADVTGTVRAASGTLSVLSLAPTTLREDGTLTQGAWSAAPGARLELPPVTTNDARLTLEGAGAALSGPTSLVNGPDGTVDLWTGADLELSGRFRNEGRLQIAAGSGLDTGASFAQAPTGKLVTEVDATGLGRVRADGRRNLGGTLVIRRDPAYRPGVGTVRTFLASGGRVSRDDTFDTVVSPRYGARRFRVLYERDRTRMWVGRVG